MDYKNIYYKIETSQHESEGTDTLKIFIVEDDSVISKKIKEHIEKWGYEGAVVQDFQNVLSEMIAFDPQLVLMDISLPFSMAITGVGKYGRCRKCQSSLFPPLRII